jgi:WD40 repeat protein
MNLHKLFIFLSTLFCWVNIFATELQSPLLPQSEQFKNVDILLDNIMPRKPALAISFSPNGKILASSIEDTIYLWDVYSGKEIKRLKGNSAEIINALAFNGNILAAGSSDNSVYIWDVESDKKIKQLERNDDITAVAFNPKNSNILALSSVEGTVYLWDWAINKVVKQLRGHSASVNTLAFSPNGKLLASGDSNAVIYLWEPISGQKIRQFKGHSDVVTSVKFNFNGEFLVSGSWDKTVRLWDIKSGEEFKSFGGHSHHVNTVDFSPDGNTLVSGSMDNTIRLWDIQEVKKNSLVSHSDNVVAVAFSPEGQFLASASWDKTVRLWDTQAGQEIQNFAGHSSPVNIVAFNPDGKSLASGSDDHGITVWHELPNVSANTISQSKLIPHFSNGIRQLATDYHPINSFAFSPNGKLLAFGTKDGLINFFDVRSGKKIKHLQESVQEEVNVVAFSPNGKILASGSRYSTEPQFQNMSPLYLWDVQSGKKLKALQGHTNHVFALAFSPDGKILASGSDDKTIRLWEIPSGEIIKELEGHSHFVTSIVFHPKGNLLASGSWDKTVRLWDIHSAKEIKQLIGHSHYITAVTFSPNGKILASASWDKTVFLWDTESGEKLHRLKEHSDFINTLAFNKEGSRLASGSRDSTIRLWDVSTGKLQQVMLQGARNTWVNCHVMSQQCWRVDDGTLLVDKQAGGSIQPVLPVAKKAEQPLMVEASSDSLELNYGEPSSLILTIRNNDTLPIYWVNVRQEFEPENPLIFYPPKTHLVLAANETTTLQVAVNAKLNNENQQSQIDKILKLLSLQSQETTLKLSITAANSSHLNFDIPVYIYVPYPVWLSYAFFSVLLLMISIALYYLRLYRHPIVQTLSADSRQLLNIPLEQLPKAKQLLQKTHRLDTILSNNDSYLKWLNEAVHFMKQPNQARCQLLKERLSATIQHHDNNDVFILHLGAAFPLKLDRCFVYFPPANSLVPEIIRRLKRDDINFQTILVISLGATTDLRTYGEDRTNLWIIPDSRELTNLLLAPRPIDVFTRILANQLAITRLSPYQTSGGVTKDSNFFGRDKILSKILNREPKNYLVIGGRQLGKTSLLKQIQRHYQNHPKVECIYLSVSRGDKRVFNKYLIDLPKGRQRLLLIDEADVFIRKEIAEDYPTLSRFRNLSEEGRCYFIIAGFWDLYAAAVLDYHSPIKNFGESIIIGALELEACRDLAIEPMKMLGIHYAENKLVEQIITETGQRANLIAIVCDEMLKDLPSERRVLTKEEVSHALKNQAISETLLGWSKLTDDKQAIRLDRIIVYATVETGKFKLSEVMTVLDEHEYDYSTDQLTQSLARLELAFIIRRENSVYHYCVPLFREILLGQEVDMLLKHELKMR